MLLAGPALQAVAEQYPGAGLTLVGNTAPLSLLTDTLPVTTVWSGHQGRWLELFRESGDIDHRLKDLLAQFELALVLTPSEKPEFLDRLRQAGIPHVVWLPSFPQRRLPVSGLQSQRLKEIGLNIPLRPFRLRSPETACQLARSWLQDDNQKTIVRIALAPGSGHPRKNWPLNKYLELARRLEERYGAEIFWVLGPAESGLRRELPESIPPRRLVQDLPLKQLAAVLREFHLYVGNDSGVTHLAAVLGGPVVAAIFGPSDPVIWSPQGDGTVVVTPEQPCAPCTMGREITCPHPVCLTTLTTEKVLAAISRFLPPTNV